MKLDHKNERQSEPQTKAERSSQEVVKGPTEMAHEANRIPPLPQRKKPVASIRKIAANRVNSMKSTGPRTVAGKKTVRRNAVKHGFLSKFLVVNEHESQAEYDELCKKIWRHYEPLGFAEEHCAEQLAILVWRLRRVLRFERGNIAWAIAEEHAHEVAQINTMLPASLNAPAANLEREFLADQLFLPGNGNLDKVLRYETMINKQLNHAFAELERLQRRRRGETVPAPITLNISD